MQASQETELAQIRDQIAQLRVGKERARYTESIKRRVAALSAAGVSRAHIAKALKLGTSQISEWCKHSSMPAKVFDVVPPDVSLSEQPVAEHPIQIVVGPVVLTIAYRAA